MNSPLLTRNHVGGTAHAHLLSSLEQVIGYGRAVRTRVRSTIFGVRNTASRSFSSQLIDRRRTAVGKITTAQP